MKKEYDLKKLKVKRRGILPAAIHSEIEKLKLELLHDPVFLRALARELDRKDVRK